MVMPQPTWPVAPEGARSISILGATGSIGRSTLDVLGRHPERWRVEAVTADRNAVALAETALKFGARFAAVADEAAGPALREALAGSGIACGAGTSAVLEAAERDSDMVMGAITGAAGLAPGLAALKRGVTMALANKESLVAAGGLFMRTAKAHGATVLPVDSEHNAVFQSLLSGAPGDITRITLTASGGPFRTLSAEEIAQATPKMALRHPNWSMGPKITIDSASLMNKGLELIEAQHLFGVPASMLDVLVHPQSIIHGMVAWRDGSVVAMMGAHDMRIPIAHCLAWPERVESAAPTLDLARIGALTFEAPDVQRFPCLALARQAMEAGGALPTVLNAANEIAVAAFLDGAIGFMEIAAIVDQVMNLAVARGMAGEPQDLAEVQFVDHEARSLARKLLPDFAAKPSYGLM